MDRLSSILRSLRTPNSKVNPKVPTSQRQQRTPFERSASSAANWDYSSPAPNDSSALHRDDSPNSNYSTADPRPQPPPSSSSESSTKTVNQHAALDRRHDDVALSPSLRAERGSPAESKLHGRTIVSSQDSSSDSIVRSSSGTPPSPPPPPPPTSACPHDSQDSAAIARGSKPSPTASSSTPIVSTKPGRLELVANLCRKRVVRTWWRGLSCGVCFAAGAWVREGYETFGVWLALAALLGEMVIHEFIIDGR